MKAFFSFLVLGFSFMASAESKTLVLEVPYADSYDRYSTHSYFDLDNQGQARVALIAHENGNSRPEGGYGYFTASLKGLEMKGQDLYFGGNLCGTRKDYQFNLTGKCELALEFSEDNTIEVFLVTK